MDELLQRIFISEDRAFRADSFESIIYPKSVHDFFSENWECRPFFVERNAPGYFDNLLGLLDVDFYIGTRTFHEPDIRLVKSGKDSHFKSFSKGGVVDRDRLLQEFKGGATIIFSHLNRHHLPLAECLSICEAQLHLPMRSNVYLSPPGSKGFNAHWDTHDVLVLQLSGSKRWHFFESPYKLPHEDQKRKLKSWVDQAEKVDEVVVRPGSVLFVPRGVIHAAEAEDEHSLHITIGLRSLTVADVLLRAFRTASLDRIEMRSMANLKSTGEEACPALDLVLVRSIVESMDISCAAEEVYCSFIKSRHAPVAGALMAAIHAPRITHEDRLRLRKDVLFKTFRRGNSFSVAVDGVVKEFPPGVEGVIDFIRSGDTFTPQSLPGVEHDTKLIVINALLDCRLVEFVN